MARKPPYRAVAKIDPAALASFQAGIRKRYSNEQIVDELRKSAERIGRSPTMREFAADPETTVHPQTVIEHFGSWNAAKREAGLVPRRRRPTELLAELRQQPEQLLACRKPAWHEPSFPLGGVPAAEMLDHGLRVDAGFRVGRELAHRRRTSEPLGRVT